MAEISRSQTFTGPQSVFVSEYLGNGRNASAAYRAAYPDAQGSRKDIATRASRLLKVPKVKEAVAGAVSAPDKAVAAAVVRYEITAERVADELARLAFTRLDQVADVRTETGPDGKRRQRIQVKDFADVPDDALAAIVEVKRTVGGEVSVKLADKRAALMDIARLKGWIADKPVDNKQLVMLKIER